jgi:hypothetical protein
VLWTVTALDLRSEPLKFGGPFRGDVTPGDGNPATHGDECKRTHTCAGYPHEVDGPGIVRGEEMRLDGELI